VPDPTPLPVAGEFRRVRAGMNAEQVVAQSARLGRCEALSLLYAVPAALCRPLTAPATVVVVLPGVALLALAAWRHGPPRRTVCSWRSVLAWVVLVLLFGGWELIAALWGNDSAHPTFSLLVDPVLETYPGRLVGWLAWLAVGRWLVTR
jgi:hypothetical protein